MNLSKLSAEKLEEVAEKATALAALLRLKEPSNNLCIENGIVDCSYDTQSNGFIPSFQGETIVTMADGSKWKCKGHGPKGSAYDVSQDGYIEKTKIN
tara:strand:+ start:2747 stop:3037 length:291 start_codon:yes stop_codon:yes gene_type:complete